MGTILDFFCIDIFYNNMCRYCKNINNCKEEVNICNKHGIISYNCQDYIKDDSKIKGYESPLFIAAKRDYFKLEEF